MTERRQEVNAMLDAIKALSEKVDAVQVELAHRPPPLTEEEKQWVRLAIKREAQSYALRQALIEKGLIALLVMAIGFLGFVFKEFFTLHGWKN